MVRTPKVKIENENEFVIKDVTVPKPINLERLDEWVVKDHTRPKDIKVYLPIGAGTYFHNVLQHRDWADQHPISAITNLQTVLDSKLDIEDFDLIDCGTSTEVI